MHPSRIRKAAVVLKPATLTKFRSALLSRNYHLVILITEKRKAWSERPLG